MAEKNEEKKLPDILKHYVLPPLETMDGIFKAKCKHCHKTISRTTKVTTNWLKHMASFGSVVTNITSIYIYRYIYI